MTGPNLSQAVERESNRSTSNANCIEVARLDEAVWRKSSRSDCSSSGECVEVTWLAGPANAVRDSKNPHGPVLNLPSAAWSHFLDLIS
jgi:hypothetical protein